ncbi:hypothetical protein J2T41_005279 [Pseudomonas citronellolis]|uniref:hypothetical protein n=1 Tax=Pseudomonas citronellolis TaxID=53408 RepID=UPI00209E6ACF|nr:hypothetical protein [Pseudomonas citronellolis]MCP1645633.1 hypothetical protein [Pseudomonas citronellolis]MCP1667495.1 hypothetical protein [Pseudomonas citronellolis]MCP1699905.1 hypothetical protein [Pseudomonas citronellolis]MCP1705347.1 hypothetical protein [Pseudomonas citronellolis]MCP1800063.1 hypothetical protein [Pseudomonas citronellolis]
MEPHNENTQSAESDNDDTSAAINPAVIGWGVAAVVCSIIMIVFNTSPLVLGASFFTKLFAVIVGSVLGWIGALLGDAIRKFAHPDAVYTNGGILSLVWIKVFWLLGPQVIGLIAGIAIGCGVVLR